MRSQTIDGNASYRNRFLVMLHDLRCICRPVIRKYFLALKATCSCSRSSLPIAASSLSIFCLASCCYLPAKAQAGNGSEAGEAAMTSGSIARTLHERIPSLVLDSPYGDSPRVRFSLTTPGFSSGPESLSGGFPLYAGYSSHSPLGPEFSGKEVFTRRSEQFAVFFKRDILTGGDIAQAVATALEGQSIINAWEPATAEGAAHLADIAGEFSHASRWTDKVNISGPDPAGKRAPAPKRMGFRFWSSYLGDFSHQKNIDGFSGYDAHTNGVLGGICFGTRQGISAGVYGGYSRTGVILSGIDATVQTNTAHTGVYLRYQTPVGIRITADGASSFANSEVQTVLSRNTQKETARGDLRQKVYSAGVELSYAIRPTSAMRLSPFIAGRVTRLTQDAYTEHSDASVALDAFSANSISSTVGAELGYDIRLKHGVFTPRVSLAWLHSFSEEHLATDLTYTGLSTPLTVKSAPLARDAARIGLGADGLFTTAKGIQWGAKTSYHLELCEKAQGHIFSVGAEVRF